MSWNPFGWMRRKASENTAAVVRATVDELRPEVARDLAAVKESVSAEVDRKLDDVEGRIDRKLDDVEARLDRKLDDVDERVDRKLDRVVGHAWGMVAVVVAAVVGTSVAKHQLEKK